MADFDLVQIAIIAAVGLTAGVLGGMLGVGGSLIMIPSLVYLYGQGHGSGETGLFGSREFFDQHLYQAAAMAVNVAVVVPATWRHWQAKAVMPGVLMRLLPWALVFILVGVAASNLPVFRDGRGPVWLGRVMAVFLIYVIGVNIRRLIKPARPIPLSEGTPDVPEPVDPSPARCGVVGSLMGFVAGLMGIGGGAIAVPMQQMLLKLRLRNCIANSAAVICFTAGIGAVYKIMSLPGEARPAALTIAALLAPTALVGGWVGGKLTHTVPVSYVRAVWVVTLIAAAWKMAAL